MEAKSCSDSLSAEPNSLSGLSEDRRCQLSRPAGPPGQHCLQVSPVPPQSLDFLPDGRQPVDHGLSHQQLVGARVQLLGLGQRLFHADLGRGGVDGHQVGHARPRLRVEGDLGGEVGDGAADLEGDVIGRVGDGDGGHGLGVGLGHFGGRITQGFDLPRGACGRRSHGHEHSR